MKVSASWQDDLSRDAKRTLLMQLLRARAGQPKCYPASFSQERLWFFEQMEPGTGVYNNCITFELRGRVDIELMKRTLREIVKRHEVLRTTLVSDGGHLLQVIRSDADIALPVIHLSRRDKAARETEIGEIIERESQRPFELKGGVLFRAALIVCEEQRKVLVITIHHLVSDGWSLVTILPRELATLYGNFLLGQPPSLAPLPMQFGEFALLQRDWLTPQVLDAQVGYWRQALGDDPPLLDLPTDFPRPRLQTYRGASVLGRLPATLTEDLKRISRERNATLFMVLLTAFGVLLGRLSGQERVSVGTPMSGRIRSETEGLIGFFVNTLVMSVDRSGNPTFYELLEKVAEWARGAYRYQELPFDRLVQELRPPRDSSRTPVFQVLFNMLSFSAQRRWELPGLVIEFQGGPQPASKFDLTFYVAPDEGGLSLQLVYNADLFTPDRMEEVLSQYRSILGWACTSPTQQVGGVSLATGGTAATTLPNPTVRLARVHAPNVVSRFSCHTERTASKIAMTDMHGSLSYGHARTLTTRVAACLRAHGVGRGDLVALYGHRCAALAWGMLGVWSAGAGFVVLDPTHSTPRLIETLKVGRPRAWLEVPGAVRPDDGLTAFLGVTEWSLQAELRALADPAPDMEVTAEEIPKADDGAYVAFTSGTTGGVKGIQGTQGPIAHFLSWYERTFDLGPDDRFSMLSGLSHDPLLRDVFAPLWVGGTLCVPNPEELLNPARLRAWLARERVTVSHLTPPLARVLTEDAKGGELPHLRLVCLGGDVLTSEVVRSLRRVAPSARIVNFYGATETPQAMGWYEVPPDFDDRSGRTIPLGRGIDDVQLLVLAENGQLAGVGELGEIVIRTPHLARGYLGDEALTRARFITNPFTEDPDDRMYRTGDLGRFSPDGLVEFFGRRDGQVKIRGYRVELGEVEAAAAQVPGVKQVVVVARDGTGADKRLVGYAVGDGGLTVRTMRNALAARLPDYMVPSAWVFLDGLPLTPNGKVDRRNLPDPEAQPAGTDHYVAPRTPTEESLVAIWREVLKIDQVGVEDNFFDLGGHSLLMMQVVSRVERVLEIAMPVRSFFEFPTIAALAAEIERRRPQGHATFPGAEIEREEITL